MEDFLKQPLAIGDHVIFMRPGYRSYLLGCIDRFTGKMVHVVCGEKGFLQAPHSLVKVPGTAVTTYMLKR